MGGIFEAGGLLVGELSKGGDSGKCVSKGLRSVGLITPGRLVKMGKVDGYQTGTLPHLSGTVGCDSMTSTLQHPA